MLGADYGRAKQLVILSVLSAAIGFGASLLVKSVRCQSRISRIIAMSWGDGIYGKGFYGAEVFLEPISTGFSVQARVHIGRGNGYFHDCGELGIVANEEEAVAQWSQFRWHDDGLHIGIEGRQFFLPRKHLESHR